MKKIAILTALLLSIFLFPRLAFAGYIYRIGDKVSIGQYSNDFDNAITKIGSLERTLVIDTNIVVTQDVTVPATCGLEIGRGGSLTYQDANVDLTINGPVHAGPYQWIDPNRDWVDFGAGSAGKVYPQWWGAAGDGSTASATAINRACGSFASGVLGEVILLPGTYSINTSILIPLYVSLIGHGHQSIIIPDSAGTYTGEYAILINSTDGSSQTTTYPKPAGKIAGIYINNTSQDPNTKGIFCAASYQVEDIQGRYLDQVLVTAGSSNYEDALSVKRIYCYNPAGSNYQIRINQLSDGLNIDQIFCSGSGNLYTLRVRGCKSGTITNCIGGYYKFEYSDFIEVSGLHTETGQVEIDYSNISLKDCMINKGSYIPILISASSGDGFTVSLENVFINFWIDYDYSSYEEYDIKTASNCKLNIINCGRKITDRGNAGLTDICGLKICKSTDADFKRFNDYSYIFSNSSTIAHAQSVIYDHSITSISSNIYGFGTATTTSRYDWGDPNGTYYYKVQALADPIRMIGWTDQNGERSQYLSEGGDGVWFAFIPATTNRAYTVRLYKGTSTGSYDEYVDVPFTSCRSLYDDGNTVNGFEWQSRTAGNVDSVYNGSTIRLSGSQFECWGIAVPTVGTWVANDRIIDTSLTAGDSLGWITITSGTFSAATDPNGDTDGSTAVITGMDDTSDFFVDEYVTVSAGFPSATASYRITAKTASTLTLDTASDSAENHVTVATPDPVFKQYGVIDLSGSVTWDPNGLVDGAGQTSSSITVTGAALGDYCICSAPYDLVDMIATCYVQAANTVEIRLQNESGASHNLASGSWKVKIIK